MADSKPPSVTGNGYHEISRASNLHAKRYSGHDGPVSNLTPRYNLAPGINVVSICKHAYNAPLFEQARWGFKPAWATGKAPVPINARIESLNTPYFREAFQKYRCVVPANGWYEWEKASKGKKTPYFITAPELVEDEVLFFAAIYTPIGPDSGTCVAIITEPAADTIRHIHDRQPVLIHPDSLDDWLDPNQESKALKGKVKRTEPEKLAWWPVSTRVNRPVEDDATLIEAVSKPEYNSGPFTHEIRTVVSVAVGTDTSLKKVYPLLHGY